MHWDPTNSNLFSIKPTELQLNQHFWISNDLGKLEEHELVQHVITKQGGLIEMDTLNLETGLQELVCFHVNYPRDLYVNKLNTNWQADT